MCIWQSGGYNMYIEKKPRYNIESELVLKDLQDFVGVTSLKGLRIINRYLIEENLCEDIIKDAITYNKKTDYFYSELPNFGMSRCFAVELLPGQFDQDAHTASGCIALRTGETPIVRCAKIYILDGDITDEEYTKIKGWLINPVDSREIPLERPKTIKIEYKDAPDVEIVTGFIKLNEKELEEKLTSMNLAMDLPDFLFCQAYFRDEEKRDPTITEIKMLDAYWSDHCRHTTFLTELTDINIDDEHIKQSFENYLKLRSELGRDDKPITLMDMATIGAKVLKKRGFLKELDESDEVNACCVKIEANINGELEDWLLYFKNETHNHPTEIEPFGGAATCLGGGIRDPLSGRSFVHQAMRITGAADPRTPFDKTIKGKHPQLKICRTAAAGYSSYGNQVGGTSGFIQEIYHPGFAAKRMELGALVAAASASNVIRKVPQPGDVVFLIGAKTGRDGCGAATGSSKTQGTDVLDTGGPEVQRGDAPEERKIIRLFTNPEATRLIKRCNDFGAGGVSVAIGELADGLDIDLDKVPVKYGGLDGTELAISESQERMACVVAAEDAEMFIKLASDEDVPAVIVAIVTDNNRMTMKWRGKTIVNLARSFLSSNGTQKKANVIISKTDIYDNVSDKEHILTSINLCSQKGLIERFDYSIGSGTVLAPLGGLQQLTPIQAMVSRLPVKGVTDTCSLMSFGYDPFISSTSPYHGAIYAVISSIAKIIATGGSRKKCWLSFQEYFERLGNDSVKWGKPAAALLGALDVQMGLEIGSVGGKDSMSGSYEDLHVPPTLVSICVSIADEKNIISPEFKQADSKVYFFEPDFDVQTNRDYKALAEFFDKIEDLISKGLVKSAWAIGLGGTYEGIAKMCFGNKIGYKGTINNSLMGIIIESEDLQGYEKNLIGHTTKEYILNNIDLNTLQKEWEEPLESVYPTVPQKAITPPINKPAIKINSSSKYFIPIFPGTNSEHDILKSCKDAKTLVIKSPESVQAMKYELENSNRLIFAGGEISTNYIVSFLKREDMQEAIMQFLQNKDNAILGLGGGFAALIKLGLLPNGKICENKTHAVSINTIGRHRALVTKLKIVSNKSPWLGHFNIGDEYMIPVSSEYGRITAENNCNIAAEFIYNPFGSDYNIAGIESNNGRILGLMAYPERIQKGLLKNIPVECEMNIF